MASKSAYRDIYQTMEPKLMSSESMENFSTLSPDILSKMNNDMKDFRTGRD